MDKIKINRQIVSMRKCIEQAKVRLIHRFSKQVKKLRNCKGSDQKVEKAKRKADRILKMIYIVKTMKSDNIAKAVLVVDKNWKAVANQKDCSLELRCIANLATFSSVEKAVKSFYNENQELIPKLQTVIEQWQENKEMVKYLPSGITAKERKMFLEDQKEINDLKRKWRLSRSQTAADSGETKEKDEKSDIEVLKKNNNVVINTDSVTCQKEGYISEQSLSSINTSCRTNKIDQETDNLETQKTCLLDVFSKELLETKVVQSNFEMNNNTEVVNVKTNEENKLDCQLKCNTSNVLGKNMHNALSEDCISEKKYSETCLEKKEKPNVQNDFHISAGNKNPKQLFSLNDLRDCDRKELNANSEIADGETTSSDDSSEPSDTTNMACNMNYRIQNDSQTFNLKSGNKIFTYSPKGKKQSIKAKESQKAKAVVSQNELLELNEIPVNMECDDHDDESGDSDPFFVVKSAKGVKNKSNDESKDSDSFFLDNSTVDVKSKLNIDNGDKIDKLLNTSLDAQNNSKNIFKSDGKTSAHSVKKRRQNAKNSKIVAKNSEKAIAVLDINELQGLDEIPVSKKCDDSDEECDLKIALENKDPFFLGCTNTSEDDKEETDMLWSKNVNLKNNSQGMVESKLCSERSKLHKKEFLSQKKSQFQKKNKYSHYDEDMYKRNNTKAYKKAISHENKNLDTSKSKNSYKRDDFKQPNRAEKYSKTEPSVTLKTEQPSVHFHPSWEAKRKQKELLKKTSFQGKRIVFED